MFITKKVEYLLPYLRDVKECLVFAEIGMVVPNDLIKKHAFEFSQSPQLAYCRFVEKIAKKRFEIEKGIKFNLSPGGYYISEDSLIKSDAYIEPGCVIGPDVQIGSNAKIYANSVIRRSTIGDDFLANENAVIGSNGFTMTVDNCGNKIRIPTLGRVIIGNNVEVGSHNNISCGSAGDTRIDDHVKLDALVHIAHDVHLHSNVEVTAGVTIGGFLEAGEGTYIGLGSVLRNRISLGEHSFVGMGSNVTKPVASSNVVVGNPAKPFEKR